MGGIIAKGRMRISLLTARYDQGDLFNLAYDNDVMLPIEVGEQYIRRKLEDLDLNEEQLRAELDTLPERHEATIV